MSKRTEAKEKRKIEILMVALDLFVRKGYDGTKTSDIGKELNISDGLLFHYFSSKEALYKELILKGLQNTKNLFNTNYENTYFIFKNTLEDLFRLVRADRNVSKMFVLMEQAQNKFVTPESVWRIAKRVNIIEESVKYIEKGQKEKIFRIGDPLALSYTFWNSVQGNMEEIAKNPNMPIPEVKWLMSILENKGDA